MGKILVANQGWVGLNIPRFKTLCLLAASGDFRGYKDFFAQIQSRRSAVVAEEEAEDAEEGGTMTMHDKHSQAAAWALLISSDHREMCRQVPRLWHSS